MIEIIKKIEEIAESTEKEFDALIDAAKNLGKPPEPPLLVIELENESAVPKVFYKGEEINLKCSVLFDWETDTSIPGGLTYAIEHGGLDSMGIPYINRIERRVKGHATD